MRMFYSIIENIDVLYDDYNVSKCRHLANNNVLNIWTETFLYTAKIRVLNFSITFIISLKKII